MEQEKRKEKAGKRSSERLADAMRCMETYSSVMWWLLEISDINEADEEPQIGWVGGYDYVIANAYAAMLQVLYLYAEKEGVIRPFSGGLADCTGVFGMDENDISVPHRVAYENALVLAERYGWEFPEKYNFSRRAQEYSPHTCRVTELDECLVRRIICEDCNEKKKIGEYEKYLADYRGYGRETFIESNMSMDAVACMTNPRWNGLQVQYGLLPDERKERLADLFRRTLYAVRRVTSDLTDDYMFRGDSLADGDGAVIDVCYISYVQTLDYGGEWFEPPLVSVFSSSRLGTLMAAADNMISEFEKEILACTGQERSGND